MDALAANPVDFVRSTRGIDRIDRSVVGHARLTHSGA